METRLPSVETDESVAHVITIESAAISSGVTPQLSRCAWKVPALGR